MRRFVKQAVVGKKIGKSLFCVDVGTIDNGMNDREMEIGEPTSEALPNVRPEQKLGLSCTLAEFPGFAQVSMIHKYNNYCRVCI